MTHTTHDDCPVKQIRASFQVHGVGDRWLLLADVFGELVPVDTFTDLRHAIKVGESL